MSKDSELTQKDLAVRFGASQSTTRRMVRASGLSPVGYGGPTGMAPLFTTDQADAIAARWAKQRERTVRATSKKLKESWKARRGTKPAPKIHSLAEVKRRAGKGGGL